MEVFQWIITFVLLLNLVSASFIGWEAKDDINDTGYKNADLIYASVWVKNGETHLEIKVAGKIEESLYCEFDLYGRELKKIYYNGGHIFMYNETSGGEVENASYKIKNNILVQILPWEVKGIKNISVNVDIKVGKNWYFDKISPEQFELMEGGKKSVGFDFVLMAEVFAIFLLGRRVRDLL